MEAVSRYGQASVMDLSLSKERGKSGQRRVPYHLTDGSRYCGNRQCHRKLYRHAVRRDKGENVW